MESFASNVDDIGGMVNRKAKDHPNIIYNSLIGITSPLKLYH